MFYYHTAELFRCCNKRMLNKQSRMLRRTCMAWIIRDKQMTFNEIGGASWD